MSDRGGIFEGSDPFVIIQRWMGEATEAELNDPNAIALSTVDSSGLPNARMVLLKDVEHDAFVFYTNYTSQKASELDSAGKAARLGAWASDQSKPLASRTALMAKVAKITATKGTNPDRPPFWGGFRIRPVEIELWADGAFRLHDRFVWRRPDLASEWEITRLNPKQTAACKRSRFLKSNLRSASLDSSLSDFEELDPETLRDCPLEAARVKWFDKAKGFGFANVFGRPEDVFVHVEILRRSGLSDLQPGEALAIRVIDGKRGRMATEVCAWETAVSSTS
ncbi:Pyridoxine/pyridoxamine 5'-phosphate oxidase [Nymphon striatum]|nr:Pyridoxine/pyridoxamine 5'-phosphate oxidase [Nymphon striatum]